MKITREKDKTLNTWIWKADFRHRGKRYRPKAFSKGDLEELVTQIKSNSDRREAGLKSRAPGITLRQLLDEHLREFDLTKKTHRRGRVILETFVDRMGGDTAVESLAAPDIRDFILWRKEKSNLKPESVNKEVGYISSMLRRGPEYFRQLSDYVPPKMPWAKVPKESNQRVIYPEEIDALLGYLKFEGLHPREKPTSRLARLTYADMFELALFTAMRWGEIRVIRFEMIDWRKAVLNLPKEVTKTNTSRAVPLNSKAVEILKRRKAESVSEYVFPGNTPDVPRAYVYEGLRRAAKKLGLSFGRGAWSPHSTRHSVVSKLLEQGVSLSTVQQITGQSSQTITMRYAHSSKRQARDAVEGLAGDD